eukprot:Skav203333  [mRNA]  locus=scaffold284:384185:385955:- [translate_table: standard]
MVWWLWLSPWLLQITGSHGHLFAEELPGTDSLNWPNRSLALGGWSVGRSLDFKEYDATPRSLFGRFTHSLTVVNRSIFGFTAIALGDGFLVPTHTTGGVYVMEAMVPRGGRGMVVAAPATTSKNER